MRLNALLVLLVAGCASSKADPHPAGSQSTIELVRADSIPHDIGQVSSVTELPGGRIALTDGKNKLFLIASLTDGRLDTVGVRVDTIGLKGPNVGEYKFPGYVTHLGGDTLAVVDFAAIRTTLWNEQGQFLKVLGLPMVGGMTPTLNYDRQGHGYKPDYTSILGGNDPGSKVLLDSFPLLRLDVNTQAVDTVAQLRSPNKGDAYVGRQTQEVAIVYGPNDIFGVLPDGTIWIARTAASRVDWRSPDGQWTIGTPIKYDSIPVTAEERDRFMEKIRERGLPTNIEVHFPFALTHPVFEAGFTSPAGEAWLQMPRKQENDGYTYQVVSQDGSTRVARLPPGATLVGFGEGGAVYAAVKSESGTVRVVRFKPKG